jgi:hypothetical protein
MRTKHTISANLRTSSGRECMRPTRNEYMHVLPEHKSHAWNHTFLFKCHSGKVLTAHAHYHNVLSWLRMQVVCCVLPQSVTVTMCILRPQNTTKVHPLSCTLNVCVRTCMHACVPLTKLTRATYKAYTRHLQSLHTPLTKLTRATYKAYTRHLPSLHLPLTKLTRAAYKAYTLLLGMLQGVHVRPCLETS